MWINRLTVLISVSSPPFGMMWWVNPCSSTSPVCLAVCYFDTHHPVIVWCLFFCHILCSLWFWPSWACHSPSSQPAKRRGWMDGWILYSLQICRWTDRSMGQARQQQQRVFWCGIKWTGHGWIDGWMDGLEFWKSINPPPPLPIDIFLLLLTWLCPSCWHVHQCLCQWHYYYTDLSAAPTKYVYLCSLEDDWLQEICQ